MYSSANQGFLSIFREEYCDISQNADFETILKHVYYDKTLKEKIQE